jgi:hypothetical protein
VLPGGGLVDGDDVLVRHQHDRPLGTAARPSEQQAVRADPLPLQGRVQQRELARQLVVERLERRSVDRGLVGPRHGGDPDQRLQLLDHGRIGARGETLGFPPHASTVGHDGRGRTQTGPRSDERGPEDRAGWLLPDPTGAAADRDQVQDQSDHQQDHADRGEYPDAGDETDDQQDQA